MKQFINRTTANLYIQRQNMKHSTYSTASSFQGYMYACIDEMTYSRSGRFLL